MNTLCEINVEQIGAQGDTWQPVPRRGGGMYVGLAFQVSRFEGETSLLTTYWSESTDW